MALAVISKGAAHPRARAFLILAALLVLAGGMWQFAAGWLAESRLLRADLNGVPAHNGMMHFAVGKGRRVFTTACVGCHRSSGQGDPARGVPALNDSDWLYGSGLPTEIEQTVTYGIRSHHPKSWNLTAMPAFARPIPLANLPLAPLTPGEIHDLVEFLIARQGDSADLQIAARGARLFAGRGGCYDCHALDAQGDSAIGAPNLTDRIWLYGDGGREALSDSIAYGRQGMCPSWINRLSPAEIREVSLYVFSISHPSSTPKVE
jgi:cytochrome c oxidase cbb3-type subunit 3